MHLYIFYKFNRMCYFLIFKYQDNNIFMLILSKNDIIPALLIIYIKKVPYRRYFFRVSSIEYLFLKVVTIPLIRYLFLRSFLRCNEIF